ncbi:MAG TPA: hypothetical protein DDZ80_20395 [Cyanobacteria bacterium UBA8803]|nr:hypothetical protein [Cyanobacteria bacterium UBA9273]HBL60710.1 hypothetical protein [Cyanobacteria bacterium UBA8803]
MKNNQKFVSLLTAGLLLNLLHMAVEPTIAQSTSNSSDSLSPVLFKPPPDDAKPQDTAGAGSRGQCPQDVTSDTLTNQPSLMALVPPTNYGLTLAAHPTFWVYLPKTSAKQVVLIFREEGTQYYSETFIPISSAPGVISVTPSQDSPALEVGKNYQWALVLMCGEVLDPNDPILMSWVRRVAPSQSTFDQLDQTTPLEQAVWYGKQGIWYDALTALAQVKRSQPNNKILADIWAKFLESAGLGVVSTEPLRF